MEASPFLTPALDASGQIHIPAALTKRKQPQYLLYMRLGGPQSLSVCYEGEKISFSAGN
jgi:hypothetical protein